MEDVVVSSEGGSKEVGGGGDGGSTSSGVVRWERFLPNMVMRVLLIEADDSTRQIITALLRKCSYKVAAVSDGLKAWEVLRKRPHSIDLILTEVDLPSISGFALLTLIMEHEICKNIPVIMMSSQDSVSTVYKCMMRGAADFLVKPVRKNELKNLWQHVWRRQSASGGAQGPPDESVAQPKVEATAENNATSNNSSTNLHMHEEQPVGHDIEIGPQVATRVDCETSTREYENVDDHCQQRDFVSETPDSHACASPAREAIDLIGAFTNHVKCSSGSPTPNICATKIDSSPLLDLSLRRSNHSGSVNQGLDERPRLNHSDASAFSRYVNRTLQPRPSTSTFNQQKDCETFSDKQISLDYNSDARAHTISSQNYLPLSISQPGQSEIVYKHRPIQAPILVGGLRFENLGNIHTPVIPQIFCMQPGSLPAQRPDLSGHQQASAQTNCRIETTCNDAVDHSENRQEHKLETLEDRGYFSSSANSSFGNGACSHSYSISYGNNSKINTFPGMNDMLQYPTNDMNSHRAMLREAALHKFRLKRKERCFEKKVRYESRKKLAEQRPRVKGQFVRQVHNDAPAGSSAD